jgi:hypothetical protein
VSHDLYTAWLTAGDRLHRAGDWIATNWPWLLALSVACLAVWAIRRGWLGDDYRTRNDKRQAWLAACEGPRPEPAAPGSDQQLLAQCLAICPDLARKEDR